MHYYPEVQFAMNKNFKNRWIKVGLVWAGVLVITLVNIQLKDTIIEARKNKILLQLDKQFLEESTETINTRINTPLFVS